jgi:anaerobic magnesium-protoporphyrin IX monomethyl ester cyclase
MPTYNHCLCLYPYREDLKSGRCYPPVGLEIIARVLAPHCRSIDVIDLRHEPGVARDFLKPETDLVCLSVNWNRDAEFVREQIRSIPAGILTVVGGRHASEDADGWLADCPNIAVLVRGDGEEAIAEIAGGEPLEKIAGISYRRNGAVVHNPNRALGLIRDDIYPDRSLRRYRYTVDFEGADTGMAVDLLSGSRGCPHNCRFCSFSRNPLGEKRPYSARSPESVVEELGHMDADLVLFTDDIFNHDMDRAERLCDLIIERGIRKRYVVNARIEIAARMDVVRKMEQAGFVALLLGIESAQDRTLRSLAKGFDTAKIEKCLDTLRHTRMLLHGYFILGCIGETEEDMLAIAPFARRVGLDTLGLSALRTVPFDGLRQLVADSPGYHVSGKGFVYSEQISRKRLQQIRRIIWRRFYSPGHVLRLAWKLLRGRLVTPGLLARLLVGGIKGGLARRRRKRQRELQKLRRS